MFIPYAIIIAVYFRFVFGYFSRLFKRQADLYGVQLGIPIEHMIRALDDVAIATGYTHSVPNWHHHSLQERIDFLQAVIQDPTLVEKHNRRVRLSLAIYFAALFVGILFDSIPFHISSIS